MRLGAIALSVGRLRASAPFGEAAAPLIGLALLSLGVEFAAIAGVASVPVLVALWVPVALLGVITAVQGARRIGASALRESSRLDRTLLLVAVLSTLTVLFAAIAPSTKIDETYYHMLVPARVVADHGLRFYHMPWEAAIAAQLLYQVGEAPLHALGVPDAANVVSFLISAWTLLFAWRFVRAESGSATMAALCVAGASVGLYSTVWHSSAGSHAFGDLAMIVAVTLLAANSRTADPAERRSNALLISVVAACAAASKVSLWPLGVVMAAVGFLQDSRARAGATGRTCALLVTVAPWVVLFAPILAWSTIHSGSPFGPMATGVFGSTAWLPGEAQALLADERQWNQEQGLSLMNFILGASPLVWLGAVAAMFAAGIARGTRIALGAVALGQCVLVVLLLPPDPRFLGGVHFALFIIACAFAGEAARRLAARPVVAGLLLLLLVPWCAAQVYYARQFVPVALGIEGRKHFVREHVAFASDFARLDTILPRDATLLVTGDIGRIPSVYVPRRVFFDARDLPVGGTPFLFMTGAGAVRDLPAGLTAGPSVYENPIAVAETFRTPGRRPTITVLRVAPLVRGANAVSPVMNLPR